MKTLLMLNHRPHPSPLPQERGKRSQPLYVVEESCSSFVFRFDQAERRNRPIYSRKINSVQLLFLLPRGEGQGEGGRNN
jgi:hypothetical protein